jgi:hypothetical protein
MPPNPHLTPEALAVKKRLEEQYGCIVWTTQDGMFVPLKTMEARHMRNCYRQVCRALDARLAEARDPIIATAELVAMALNHPIFRLRGEMALGTIDEWDIDEDDDLYRAMAYGEKLGAAIERLKRTKAEFETIAASRGIDLNPAM